MVNEFFKKDDLEWSKFVGCTVDGAPTMQEIKSGFQSSSKAVSPKIFFSHCFIHRFALFAKGGDLLKYFHAYSKSSSSLIL